MPDESLSPGTELRGVLQILVDEHYAGGDDQVESASYFAPDLIDDLCDDILNHVGRWSSAEVSAGGGLAECALSAVTRLHRALCGRRGRSRGYCPVDLEVAASIVSIVARWLFDRAVLVAPLDILQTAFAGQDAARRRDALEVAFEEALSPGQLPRRLPPLDQNRPNLQINTPRTNATHGEYVDHRGLANYLKAALTADDFHVEVTSDWAPPERDAGPEVDDEVDNAIFRTSAMVVCGDGAGVGTGETLGTAARLLIPVLVLRRSLDTPLQNRRRGTKAIRIERAYSSRQEALGHVEWFIETYRAQILARHREVIRSTGEPSGLAAVHQAVANLDPAIFESSRLTRPGALFFTADPIAWFHAGEAVRSEVRRLVAAPTPSATSGGSLGQSDLDLRRERTSTSNLLKAAEIAGWTFSIMARLLDEHARREARQTTSTSHVIKAMQVVDWEILHAEVFG